jgi:hypothetical protein
MTEKTVTLKELAGVIRSKNAGPFELTLDVFFKDEESFNMVREAGVISKERIAGLYNTAESDVLGITFFEPAHALKITIKRKVSSASPGDTDVFGAQQHAPLMQLGFKPGQ